MSPPVVQASRTLVKSSLSSSTSSSISAVTTAAAAAASSSLRISSRPCLFCIHHPVRRRPFSTTTTRRMPAMSDLKMSGNIDARLPSTYASKTQMNKQSLTKEKLLPTDLGLLPSTLVLSPATTQDLPRWLSGDVMKRARIHFFQLKTAVQNWASLFYLLYWDAPRDPITGKKMRKPLELSRRQNIAKSLHLQFNTALAAGDLRTLERVACDGLLSQAKTRIQHRRKMGVAQEEWGIKKYLGVTYPRFLDKWPMSVLLPRSSSRVVSDKMTPLPMPNSSLRQCVVRISSVQSFHPAGRDELIGSIRRYTEYVVVQKLTFNGNEAPWRLWGTVEPTTAAELREMLEGDKDRESIVDRFRSTFGAMTGRF